MKILRPSGVAALALLTILAATWATGCKDELVTPAESLIASFHFTADGYVASHYALGDLSYVEYWDQQAGALEVRFLNQSLFASSYLWDFGDGNTSSEKDPVHTYTTSGSYSVVLTVSNGTQSSTRTKQLVIRDWRDPLTMLAGVTNRRWRLRKGGIAMGTGPEIDNNQWWSLGATTPPGERPCIMDDEYIFHRDGTWEIHSNGTLYIEDQACCGGWKDGARCWDESEPDVWLGPHGEDLSAFAGGGDYTYDFDPAAGTITLHGPGAYIGMPHLTEQGHNYLPTASKTFTIFAYPSIFSGGDRVLGLALVTPGQSWNFYLEPVSGWVEGTPGIGFIFAAEGLTVSFQNTSWDTSEFESYTWDFGDGNTSMEEDPVHTYSESGEYLVSFCAEHSTWGPSLICSYRNVYVWGGRFTPDKLSSTEGKVWVLEGAGSYKAGPYPGSGEWYEGPDTVERACQMDDMFIFRDSGTMWYDARGVMWGEPFMGISPARCVDEADIPAPFDAFTSGTRSFDATPSTFAGPGTITIIGPGAFLGYAKPFNAGEYDGLIAPRERIEYEVLGYARAGDTEVLILTIDISPIQDGSAWWTITLRSVP